MNKKILIVKNLLQQCSQQAVYQLLLILSNKQNLSVRELNLLMKFLGLLTKPYCGIHMTNGERKAGVVNRFIQLKNCSGIVQTGTHTSIWTCLISEFRRRHSKHGNVKSLEVTVRWSVNHVLGNRKRDYLWTKIWWEQKLQQLRKHQREMKTWFLRKQQGSLGILSGWLRWCTKWNCNRRRPEERGEVHILHTPLISQQTCAVEELQVQPKPTDFQGGNQMRLDNKQSSLCIVYAEFQNLELRSGHLWLNTINGSLKEDSVTSPRAPACKQEPESIGWTYLRKKLRPWNLTMCKDSLFNCTKLTA